jgi:hypothetical protein
MDMSGSCPGDGVCVASTADYGICLDGCATNDDCRAGYACRPSSAEALESPKICTPACTSDDQCLGRRRLCNEGTGRCAPAFDPAALGAPCGADFFSCRGGRCLLDGYPDGMCVAEGCRLSGDGPAEACPEGGTCVDNGAGDPEIGHCMPGCIVGAAGCRTGYTCVALAEGSTAGVCRPM